MLGKQSTRYLLVALSLSLALLSIVSSVSAEGDQLKLQHKQKAAKEKGEKQQVQKQKLQNQQLKPNSSRPSPDNSRPAGTSYPVHLPAAGSGPESPATMKTSNGSSGNPAIPGSRGIILLPPGIPRAA